jgi:hypothetical protein
LTFFEARKIETASHPMILLTPGLHGMMEPSQFHEKIFLAFFWRKSLSSTIASSPILQSRLARNRRRDAVLAPAVVAQLFAEVFSFFLLNRTARQRQT